jgi:alpha-D-ribose 1-methylphosphonate 5-phosphate C-P lyase
LWQKGEGVSFLFGSATDKHIFEVPDFIQVMSISFVDLVTLKIDLLFGN